MIIVKSIISGACVVKTNLTRVISFAKPKEIFVVSPVIIGAEDRLAREFPEEVSSKFKFVHFATDTEKDADGENIRPGIGGSVYELLRLGDGHSKNNYMPSIVKQRRKRNFPEVETTTSRSIGMLLINGCLSRSASLSGALLFFCSPG